MYTVYSSLSFLRVSQKKQVIYIEKMRHKGENLTWYLGSAGNTNP